jgi:hypothetical protein
MLAVSGISLGLGYTLNEKRLKDFGRDWIIESIVNGALVGGLAILFSNGGIISTMIYSVTVSNGTSISCQSFMQNNAALCLAYDYLVGAGSYTVFGVQHSSVLTSTATLTTGLLGINVLLGLIGSLNIGFGFVNLSFSSLVMPLMNEMQYFIKLLTTIMIGITVQAALLIAVSTATLTLILPAGIIARSFYPTKKVGAFLLALGIGLYTVFPLSYLFDAVLANNLSLSINSSSIIQITSQAQSLQNSMTQVTEYSNQSHVSTFIQPIISAASSLGNSISNILNGLILDVSYFIIYSFVLPAFSLVVTGISVRELTQILGADVNLSWLSML